MIDVERFRETPLVREPFDHLTVEGFVEAETIPVLLSSFPAIRRGGSFPLTELSYGDAFSELLDELRAPELRRAVEEKFALDLSGRPTLITVRGQARKKDGRIHTDTHTKIVTVLLYMNPGWSDPGGHLRLLPLRKASTTTSGTFRPKRGRRSSSAAPRTPGTGTRLTWASGARSSSTGSRTNPSSRGKNGAIASRRA